VTGLQYVKVDQWWMWIDIAQAFQVGHCDASFAEPALKSLGDFQKWVG